MNMMLGKIGGKVASPFVPPSALIVKPARAFGIVPNTGTDMGPKINRAMERLYADYGSGAALGLSTGEYRTSIKLGNPGVSIIGESMLRSRIVPTSDFSISDNILEIIPVSGAHFLTLKDFMIYPAGALAGVKGAKGIYIRAEAGVAFPYLRLDRVYVQIGNDYSIHISNDDAGNASGAPTTSRFTELDLFDGLLCEGLGDSTEILGGHFETSDDSRNSIDLKCVDAGSGPARAIRIVGANITGKGSAITIRNSGAVQIIGSNVELSVSGATAGSNGAVIDIDGGDGEVEGVEIYGGKVSIFGSSTADTLIRLNNVKDAIVGGNVWLANGTGSPIAQAIEITSSAINVHIGRIARQSNFANQFTTFVSDSGVGTSYATSYCGVLDCSGNPNYPAGRPGEFYIVSVSGRIGGASGPAVFAGEEILCTAQAAAGTHASVGANWKLRAALGSINQWTGSYQQIANAAPRRIFTETDATTNEQSWDEIAVSGVLRYRLLTDDLTSNAANWMTVDRNGITSVTVSYPALSTVTHANAITILDATAIPAGGTAGSGYKFSSTSNFGIFFGSGAPTLSAAKGSLYLRSDGSGTGDRMYVNTNGSTTWTAVTTAG